MVYFEKENKETQGIQGNFGEQQMFTVDCGDCFQVYTKGWGACTYIDHVVKNLPNWTHIV